jgi:hypothetical protein
VTRLIPSAKCTYVANGGNLFFLIPFDRVTDLKPFFMMIESDVNRQQNSNIQRLKKSIDEWGLSHPTLEEVFLRLTNMEDSKDTQKKLKRRITRLMSKKDIMTKSGDLKKRPESKDFGYGGHG